MTAPCLFPTIRYRDADAAIDWLKQAFGFTEQAVYRGTDGIVAHAQLALGSSILMLGQARDDAYGALLGDQTVPRTDALYVAVEDLDTVFKAATGAGAVIEQPLHDTDYGSREFLCRDPEGHLWSIGTYWPKVGD